MTATITNEPGIRNLLINGHHLSDVNLWMRSEDGNLCQRLRVEYVHTVCFLTHFGRFCPSN